MAAWIDHLVVAPILVPLAASGLMLLLDEQRLKVKRTIGIAATLILILVSALLLGNIVSASIEGTPSTNT